MSIDSFINRPSPDEYYMDIAMAVSRRANCKGSKVGAVIVRNNRIVSTGYNGVPDGVLNCLDGGCLRCANRDVTYTSGEAYDLCICVHAEQNALLSAARFGISVEDGTVYTTMQPCLGCLKELIQAHIKRVVYSNRWLRAGIEPVASEYNRLSRYIKIDETSAKIYL